jgi:DNA-binding NarL/FixJ family response regulator
MATDREDVLGALSELRAIAERRQKNEEDERQEVLRARRLGLSWRAIADALQREVSGVCKKYSDEV